MVDQLFAQTCAARKFGIGKYRFDCAAADWMDIDGCPPAAALWHRMIPVDLLTQRAQAQPAHWWRRGFVVIVYVEVPFGSLFAPFMSGH